MNIKSRRKLLWLSILLFLLIAPPIALYATGWRITSDLRLKRIGGLFVTVPESGAAVYLNGKFIKDTNFLRSGVFIQELTPGEHALRVEKENFWPWTKRLEVAESAVAEARAFLLPQNPKGKILTSGRTFESIHASNQNSVLLLEEKEGDSYSLVFYLPSEDKFLEPASRSSKNLMTNNEKLENISWKNGGAEVFFANRVMDLTFDFSKKVVSASVTSLAKIGRLPDFPAPIVDYRKKARLTFDEKSVSIEWLSELLPYFLSSSTETFFQTKSKIRGADFFPKKNDLAIIAYENGVFAVEIDGRNNRNIQPIYKGKEPLFAVSSGEIYILDQQILAKIEL